MTDRNGSSERGAWKAYLCATLLLAAGVTARAGAILGDSSASYCCGPGINDNSAVEISWTQTGEFVDVSISVPLYSFTGGEVFHVLAYLTTSIGPGTTPPALASTTESFSTAYDSPVETTLFSGLALGPGTYYLTLFGTDSSDGPNGAVWVGSEASGSPATITTAPGVTVSAAYQANGGILDTSYAPASSFIPASSEDEGFSSYDFTVTGLLVPEPASGLLLFLGLAALTMLSALKLVSRRRTQASAQPAH